MNCEELHGKTVEFINCVGYDNKEDPVNGIMLLAGRGTRFVWNANSEYQVIEGYECLVEAKDVKAVEDFKG